MLNIKRGNIQVPVEQFGKDHWSLLAYVETCCVDSSTAPVGTIDKRRLRCNENTHPLHAVNFEATSGRVKWQPSYGSRLRGYFEADEEHRENLRLNDHDDWDALNDLEDAGFLEVISEANGFVKMTTMGNMVVARIREHKSGGGNFANFRV